ncbi:hypothetical protein D3C85_1019500 [compost metagenome]
MWNRFEIEVDNIGIDIVDWIANGNSSCTVFFYRKIKCINGSFCWAIQVGNICVPDLLDLTY